MEQVIVMTLFTLVMYGGVRAELVRYLEGLDLGAE